MKFLTREEYHKKKGKKVVLGEENCPFCDFKEKILWEGNFWLIVYNFAPYSGNDKHLMAILKRHLKYFLELENDEILELKEIHKFVKNYFGEQNYFSFTREAMGQRSVEHFHMHFLIGKLKGKFLRKMLELQGFPIKQELKI